MKYDLLKQEKLYLETGALAGPSAHSLYSERMVMV